ncbi:MAG: MobA/MobL family protein [Enterococcus sp.]|nr:MobA/MobL family protein [Enterococcus sp.]
MKRTTRELLYHLHIRSVSKGKGHQLGQKLAYLHGEKRTDQHTGKTFNYEPKGVNEGIKSHFLAPSGANDKIKNREEYISQLYEREHAVKAQFYREMEVSLFKELTPEQNEELLLRFCEKFRKEEGMFVDVGIHKLNSDRPHAHIGLGYRGVDEEGNLSKKKNRDWNKRSNAVLWRERWADTANEYFREKGLGYEISHLSYAARGIDKIAQRKLPMNTKSELYKETKEYNEIIQKHNARTDYKSEKNQRKKEVVSEKTNVNKLKYLRGGGVQMAIDKTKMAEEIFKEVEQKDAITKQVERVKESARKEVEANRPVREAEQRKVEMQEAEELKNMVTLAFTKEDVYKSQHQKAEEYKEEAKSYRVKEKRHKDNAMSERDKLKNKKQRYATKKNSLKQRNKQLKLKNEQLKSTLESTTRFSISGYKQRKSLKNQIKQNKILIKMNKIEQKNERYQIKQETKVYNKQRREALYSGAKALKASVKSTINELKATKTYIAFAEEKKNDTIKKYDNVVNLKDFKAQKEKIQLSKESLKRIEVTQQRSKQQSLAR